VNRMCVWLEVSRSGFYEWPGCIGYAMADHMRTELVTAALDMAARNYRLVENAIFHSDRGTQYQCRLVRRPLAV
jgi:transposase InsO family protein